MHLCSSEFCYSRSLPWDETLGSKLWCGQHFVSAFRFIMLCCVSEFGYSTTMLWEVGKQVWFRKLIHFHSAPVCFQVWVSCHCDVDSIQFHDVIVWVRLLVHQNRVMRLRGWKMMKPVVRKVCEWNFVVKEIDCLRVKRGHGWYEYTLLCVI